MLLLGLLFKFGLGLVWYTSPREKKYVTLYTVLFLIYPQLTNGFAEGTRFPNKQGNQAPSPFCFRSCQESLNLEDFVGQNLVYSFHKHILPTYLIHENQLTFCDS